jgi:septum formation protein
MIEIPPGVRVVLASASPRRAELLRLAGLDIQVRPGDVDETIRHGEPPEDYVCRLAREKAAAVVPGPDEVVVAADTTVELDGRALAKPADAAEAREMLRALSGRRHHVHTGVTVAVPTGAVTEVVTTSVEFVVLDDATIGWYVASGEPFGKAGGYAIQGAGGALVARVDGSVTNVIGLPLAETLALLRAAFGRC